MSSTRGSVIELVPGKKYRIRCYVGRDKNNKRRYVSELVRGSIKDAERALNSKLVDREVQIKLNPAKVILDSFIDEYLENHARPRVRENTFQNYSRYLRNYVPVELRTRKLTDISFVDINRLYRSLEERGLSSSTVRRLHQVLSGVFTHAVRVRLLGASPVMEASPPRMAGREMITFPPEEARRFLEAARSYRNGVWYPIFYTALSTGMRPSEYLGLKWTDVYSLDNPKLAFITVRRGLKWRSTGGWYCSEPKTEKSKRRIPITPSLVNVLLRHKEWQEQRSLWYKGQGRNTTGQKRRGKAIRWNENNLVFTSVKPLVDGTQVGPVNLVSLEGRFKLILEHAGLDTRMRLYDLRHTYATLMFLRGAHPKLVSARLGHSSIGITLDTYTHVIPMDYGDTDLMETILNPAENGSGTQAAHNPEELNKVPLETLDMNEDSLPF